jgi:hypothetical protein
MMSLSICPISKLCSMAKRFTDTQIWEKEWFMALTPKLKCLWRYLTERCDQAGVWDPNWSLASIYIGDKVSEKDLLSFGDHIEILENRKVFIPDFINFQYGRLSESSPAHNPVFRAIEKNRLSNRVFNRVSNTLKEKEKEVEVEEEILSSKAKIEKEIFSDRQFMEAISMTHRGKDFKQAFSECFIHHSSKDPPKSTGEWKQKFNTWLIRFKSNGSSKNPSKIH